MNDSYKIVRDMRQKEPCILHITTHLLVDIELSEDLGGIKQVCVINNSNFKIVRKKSPFHVAAIIRLRGQLTS